MVGRKKRWSAMALGLVSGLALFGACNTGGVAARDDAKRPATEPAPMKIDLDRAVAVKLPEVAGLKAASFHTSDGKEGWVVRVPGNRPIATPAYADGFLFVGGGYGSHEFYAFKAKSGEVAWKMTTSDDGPTAAVVEGGYVAFNTESCSVIVVDEKTGKVIWQEWLGDPLMSQPAISNGRLFIVYPAGQRSPIQQPQAAQVVTNGERDYMLLAVDLKTGHHLWEQGIPTDVISAPVVRGDNVYITCFDGTSIAFDVSQGKVLWKNKGSATSAPIALGDQIILTKKEQHGQAQYEGLVRVDAAKGEDKDKELLARGRADYLAEGKGRGSGLAFEVQKSLDSSVGFGYAPAATKMATASKNVGVNSVVGGWAYQGSRAAHNQASIFNAQGKYLNSINAKDGRAQWQVEVAGKSVPERTQVFSPPSLGREYMYLASSTGSLVSVRQKDGQVGFAYSFKEPMVFQPALVDGNVYVGTGDGLLICLKTNEKDADGWYEWGGNAQHNK